MAASESRVLCATYARVRACARVRANQTAIMPALTFTWALDILWLALRQKNSPFGVLLCADKFHAFLYRLIQWIADFALCIQEQCLRTQANQSLLRFGHEPWDATV